MGQARLGSPVPALQIGIYEGAIGKVETFYTDVQTNRDYEICQ